MSTGHCPIQFVDGKVVLFNKVGLVPKKKEK
uniref:Uncharacterized protein n=1 Tax=Anguilla anguilla TaxID=7936 RepID=A0A0E9VRU8_ANGAN